ncbi:MAG: serine/threonine protein phosphatase [Chitinophagaceae bacterium]|nr:serine/threonine protein phosphatase [Chitinophagaceae bacterium]MCW5929194.1 serine/threonine protein phosphatase [Chitinophagaceae bacterium]
MKAYVIGDIHGGLKALEQVLEKANPSPDSKLIFLGDYVDGWGQSAQVIDYLIRLSGTMECVFIKGNHDVWCEEWLRTGYANQVWLMHGGKETISSYKNMDGQTRHIHLNWLEQMKYFDRDEKDRLFIHAGFTSMHGPEREFLSDNFTWDRTLWEMAITMDKKINRDSLLFPKRLKLFREIFIGHTPTLYYDTTTPMQGCNVWNLDTGAAFKGKLTIMDIDSKKYWQSDPVWQLYPGERGRN